MKAARWLCLAAFLVPLALAGCGPGSTNTPGPGTAAKEGDIKGKVVDIAADRQSVTLDHEAVKELDMMGMKMKFGVEDPKVLEGVQPGDQVQGRLKVQDGKYTITRLEKR